AIDTQTPGYAEAVGRVRQIMDPVAAATPAPVAPPAAGRAFADTLTAVMPAPAAPAGHPAMSLTLPAAAPPLGFPLGGPAAVGPVAPVAAGGSVGHTIAALAMAELGVAEQPPGSNDGPRIATYRTATAGAGVGPWCAYF